MAKRAPFDQFGLVGTTVDQKFRVERAVGEGGFAVVYAATHVVLERAVALKVLKLPDEETGGPRSRFIDGFVREAKAIAKIDHPAIVQVLDFGVAMLPDGSEAPWMALEWLDGRTLRDELGDRHSRAGKSPDDAMKLLRPVFEAVAYAHARGFAHRDIKPANIMVVDGPRGRVVKLLDFGIAKAMQVGEEAGSGETRTRSDVAAFSLHYAAPEQLGGMRTGPWTDVHALGLLLTEVLTGEAPYQGADRTAICSEIMAPDRPTPARHDMDVGPWETVIARALALRGSDRFRNADEFLHALDAVTPGVATRAAETSRKAASAIVADVAGGQTTLSRAATATTRSERRESPMRRMASIGVALAAVVSIGAWLGLRNHGSPSLPVPRSSAANRSPSTPAPAATPATLASSPPVLQPAPAAAAPTVVDPHPRANTTPAVVGTPSHSHASHDHRNHTQPRAAAPTAAPMTGNETLPVQ